MRRYTSPTAPERALASALINVRRSFTRAAEGGNIQAQYNLGLCYYTGTGVTVDYSVAVKNFTQAAEGGNCEAQFYLGLCYFKGTGVTIDFCQAKKWLSLAAEAGVPAANEYLFHLHTSSCSQVARAA